MLLSVQRLVLRRRLAYGYMSACDTLPFSPRFVASTTLSKNVTTVGPLLANNQLPCASNLRDTAWPAFTRSTFSLCFSDPLSKSGPWSCQSGRNLLRSDAAVVGRPLHQKADAKLEAKETNDVGERMEKEAKAVPPAEGKLNQRERLKRAVREYGATVIVFHTCISLFTLGVSYAVVSSGIDVVGLMTKIGVGQNIIESKLATGASTFVMAYAVHKVFAPARIACTLTATPFIVRHLRKIGFLKAPIPKS